MSCDRGEVDEHSREMMSQRAKQAGEVPGTRSPIALLAPPTISACSTSKN